MVDLEVVVAAAVGSVIAAGAVHSGLILTAVAEDSSLRMLWVTGFQVKSPCKMEICPMGALTLNGTKAACQQHSHLYPSLLTFNFNVNSKFIV